MRRQHTIEDQEAHPVEVTREEVIAHLTAQPHPATIRQIAHGMELKHRGRRFLPRIIQKLKKAGDIEEIHGGRYRLAGTKQASRSPKERPAEAKTAARAEEPLFEPHRPAGR